MAESSQNGTRSQPITPNEGRSVHDGQANGTHGSRPVGGRGQNRRRGRGQKQASGSNAHSPNDQQPDAPYSQSLPRMPPEPPSRGSRGRGRGRGRGARGRGGLSSGHASTVVPARNFGGRLTGSGARDASTPGFNANAPEFVPGRPAAARPQKETSAAEGEKPRLPPSTADDLPTRIHEDIDSGNYDCCICLNAVLRSSRFWTCTICWRVTHFSCVSKWLKQKRQNDGVVGEDFAPRCPACNSELPDDASQEKHCWCGKKKAHSAAPTPLSPHSCGRVCGKARGKCPHPCPAVCHAGPCPPCTEMGPPMLCYCGKQTSTLRCAETRYSESWSCQEVCDNKMPCGMHKCSRICHPDACGDCIVSMPSICYCGKTQKEIPCDKRGSVLLSYDYGQLVKPPDEPKSSESKAVPFEGCFRCDGICGRPFDCGAHICKRPCHQQDPERAHCPLSPDVVTHCPCGQTHLSALSAQPRRSCQDEIPKCSKTCDKMLSCQHSCVVRCHDGPCPPCEKTTTVRCRCGKTETEIVCGSAGEFELQCENVCRALLNCGQHKCRSICCAGRERAAARQAASKGRNPQRQHDFEAEHICLQICGRALKCGKHTCSRRCHRGACLSCTESITEELHCACGRTALYPPLPCGTHLPACQYDCTRDLPCGHPTVAHRCHDDSLPCPRCPQLVPKTCLCGKFTLQRVACGTRDLTCEKPCGKALKCQVHQCRKPCHRLGECEDAGAEASDCTQPCGRERPTCGHPCTHPCHGMSECPEDEPCRSRVVVTCECQRRKQEVRCLASQANPQPLHAAPSCDDECRRLQRNAAMKSALQVADSHEDNHMPYSAETIDHYRNNRVWGQEQEKLVRAFCESPDEKRLNFRPMAAARRAFLHVLAEDFGLDSQSQDPEPHRHVSLFKTPRFVSAPAKTLAQCEALQKRVRERERELAALEASEVAKLNAANPPGPRHPFNGVWLPARLADQAVVNPEVLTDLLPVLEQSESLPVRQARFQSMPQPNGAIAMKVLAPAAAPGGVERLLRALLPYIQGLTAGADGTAADDAVRLCYVDASMKVTRRDGDETAQEQTEGAAGAGQWNVVARPRRAAPGAEASETPTTTPGRRGGRALFTLKKTFSPAERQRRMDILAQTPAEVEADEPEEPDEPVKEEGAWEENEEVKERDKPEEKEMLVERSEPETEAAAVGQVIPEN